MAAAVGKLRKQKIHWEDRTCSGHRLAAGILHASFRVADYPATVSKQSLLQAAMQRGSGVVQYSTSMMVLRWFCVAA